MSLDASNSICVEQIETFEWYETFPDSNDEDVLVSGPSSEVIQYIQLDQGDYDFSLKVFDLLKCNIRTISLYLLQS